MFTNSGLYNAHWSSSGLSRVYNYGSFSQDVELNSYSKWKMNDERMYINNGLYAHGLLKHLV